MRGPGKNNLTDVQVHQRHTLIGHPDECWEWTGFKNAKGYGQTFRQGRTVRSNQLAYRAYVAPIPEGMVVRHRCDNPGCANPHHLELGTNADNTRDRDERGRTARGPQNGRWKHGRCCK